MSISHGRSRLRTAALVMAVGTAVTVTAACGSSSEAAGPASKKITVVSYGGDYQKAQQTAFFDPFVAKNPSYSITQDSPTDYAKLKAMAESGDPTWDLALVGNDFGHDNQGKWLEPIDYSVIDKNSLVDGYAGKYRVGADIEGTVIAYRSDKFPTAPRTWADFFDMNKFPGKRGVYKWVAGGLIEGALLADGVPRDKLYPLDIDRALRKLDTIKKDLVWWDTGAQSQQNLASGETPMAMVWVGRAVDAAKAAPVRIAWDQWLSQDGFWVIPKGTRNVAGAMQLLKYMVSEQAQAKMVDVLPYGPVNKAAAAKVNPATHPDLPTSHLDTRITVDDEWWAQNTEAMDKKFKAWLMQ